jgi:myo-inositol catabolism protein IolC
VKDIEKDELFPLYKDIKSIKGGNKYTLKELKQLAIKHKIKITKIVIITINKKIKLEDFKRILIENNIKITKKVYLNKQELIKKLISK